MTAVKNVLGLLIVLGFFSLGLLFFIGLFFFGFTSFFSGLTAVAAFAVSVVGMYMMGGVLWYFFRNFSWRELNAPDAIIERNDAPVAIEIKYDKEKKRRYLVDSRHSPRSANPRKFGRGVFIMTRKRGTFQQDSDVITLVDSEGSKIQNVRDFGDKIHFDMIETGKTHTMTINALTEHASNFDRKDSWDPLDTKYENKEKIAETWADSLKKA